MKKAVKYCIIALAMLVLAGCASITDWFQDNRTPLEYGVKLAVIDLIEQSDISPLAVVEVTGDVSRYLEQNPSARASEIISYVSKEIPWSKLTIAQTILVQSILSGTEQKIQTDIERGILTDDAYSSVREVLQWINEAAALFLQKT